MAAVHMHLNAPVVRSAAQQLLQARCCAAPALHSQKRRRGAAHCCTSSAHVPVDCSSNDRSSTSSSQQQADISLELVTITRVRTPEEWAVVWQVSELLADVFQLETRSFASSSSSSTEASAAQASNSNSSGRRSFSHWVYRISAMLYALLLHSQPDCRQLMVVARALQQHDAGSARSQRTERSSAKSKAPAAVMGAVSLTSRQAESNFAGPQFDVGTQYALVNNMAVVASARRRGIARLLMNACEAAAVQLLDPRPRFMALLCYKDNEAAHRLYQSSGFTECTAWQDTQWLHDAERGKLGKPQRLLMVKHLAPQRCT